MEEIKLQTWELFEERIATLRAERQKRVENGVLRPSEFLFRGQENSSWNLSTTLERAGRTRMALMDYYELIHRILSKIENLDYGKWNLRAPFDFSTSYDSIFRPNGTPTQGEYSYMAYLRHHGFPSPLLDWTFSEDIAAFFAFSKPKSDAVAICVYQQSPAGLYANGSVHPFIKYLGPNVITHPRHNLQQASYTMCLRWTVAECMCIPHEEAFAPNTSQPDLVPVFEQDALLKFVLPATERIKVLRKLDAQDFNAFSLFATQESLMDTLAIRELDLHEE